MFNSEWIKLAATYFQDNLGQKSARSPRNIAPFYEILW